MLGQVIMSDDGIWRDKIEIAINRLKQFEPPEGYYLAFSGGKDSQCVYHLCKMAGVKFDAHYAVTSVDPPELVQFIKKNYPDVSFDRKHWKDGRPITMWNLIPAKRMPPTQLVRYCCEKLKEAQGEGRVTVTGVRWAEGVKRKINHGVVTIPRRKVTRAEKVDERFTRVPAGGIVLNFDGNVNRRTVEYCFRTEKTLVNPIVDWSDDEVWEFLNSNGIPHCCLYDEGFKRIGCIGCPMGRTKQMTRDFKRWPKYKDMYLKAFAKMLKAREENGLPTVWKTPEEVMDWWLELQDYTKNNKNPKKEPAEEVQDDGDM